MLFIKSAIVGNKNRLTGSTGHLRSAFQTVIDGFDPDKFRQVNKTTAAVAASAASNRRPTLDRSFSALGSSTEMDVPGAVPTYDRAEQKLIASLEQELGVL